MRVIEFTKRISWPIALVGCLTLGLAPFTPMPHIYEKIEMLVHGQLKMPIDIFDLLFHSVPWIVLSLKISARLSIVRVRVRGRAKKSTQ